MVPVSELLFGLDWRMNDQVTLWLETLRGGQRDLVAYIQRGFKRLSNQCQRLEESHCPAVFVLRPKDRDSFWEKVKQAVAPKAVLQLYCDAPGHWHPTLQGGHYEIDVPAEWLETVLPYIRGLIKVLKYAAPLVGPILGRELPDLKKAVENDITLMKALVEKLPDLESLRRHGLEGSGERWPDPAQGAALRALRVVLDQKDPAHKWGGLRKVLTPEGDYLWLCDEHAQEYRV
jgi:internalin A